VDTAVLLAPFAVTLSVSLSESTGLHCVKAFAETSASGRSLVGAVEYAFGAFGLRVSVVSGAPDWF